MRCSMRRHRNKRRARPRASARSADGQEHRLHTARIRLLPSIESARREVEPRHRRSGAASGPTATCRTPSRPDDGPRVSTTTATTAHAITTIVDVGGATTATTTATAAGCQTKGVHGPLARASATQSSLRASVLRPTYLGMTGTPTPACGSRTTDLLATPGAIDELFVINNLPLYLGDSARTWLEHLPQ
jgi:hypothetical protein